MGGRCGTVWSVCLCSEACAGRGGARDGAVVRLSRECEAYSMICGRADAASGPLNGGPGGGSAGAASVVWCRVLVERISIKWSKTDFSIWIHSSHVPCRSLSAEAERPLGRHVVPARRRERVER